MNYKVDYPRKIALKILYEINNNKGYTNLLLKKYLKDEALDHRDRGFINQLVYGIEKNRNHIDWIIKQNSKTPFKKISPWIKEILRLGIYQIFYLDKVPDFAAVNESVNLSKKYGNKYSFKFVNGILRNILRKKEKIINYKFNNKNDELSIKYSCPKWLVEYLMLQYDSAEIESFIRNSLTNAPISIRVNSLKISKSELINKLKNEGINVANGIISYESLIIDDFSDITKYESYKNGFYFIQDEGAMLTVDVLDPKEGDVILDMCAAPGGKSTHIAERINNNGKVISRDIFEHKLKLVEDNCNRLGIKCINIDNKDALKIDEKDIERFDRILLDAPCSGLGIMRRKPDIKWNLKSQDIDDIIDIQKKMIINAFKYLKKGGALVYSTCTINKNENEKIIKYLMQNYSNARIDKLNNNIPKKIINNNTIQTMPHRDKCDGFFICKIIKD